MLTVGFEDLIQLILNVDLKTEDVLERNSGDFCNILLFL